MELDIPYSLSSDSASIPREFLCMSEEDLGSFITTTLLYEENKRYTLGNDREFKLLFLCGTPLVKDLARAYTSKGVPVYTVPPQHHKAPEMHEAIGAVSLYVENPTDPERVVSEIADVYYNIVLLTVLDADYSAIYKQCLTRISNTIGISHRDMLLLVIAKYNHRLVTWGQKDKTQEDSIIKEMMSAHGDEPPIVEPPTTQQIDRLYAVLNHIEKAYIEPRLLQITTE